jgi:hypothetical protein
LRSASQTSVQATLSSSSPGAIFAAAAGGPFASTLTLTIPAGQSAVTAYYVDPNPGSPTLTATAPSAPAANQQLTVTSPPPPQPDLRVALSASSTTAPASGAPLTLTATVSNASATNSSSASLQLKLPTSYTVTGTSGAACTETVPTLTCTLGHVSQTAPLRVTITGTLGHTGEQDAQATITSLNPPEQTPTDNTAILRLPPWSAPPQPATKSLFEKERASRRRPDSTLQCSS